MMKPKMILFDYGDTLLCEPHWDSEKGNRELMKYITKNPKKCTIHDITREIQEVFGEIERIREVEGYDFPCRTGDRLAYEHLGIEFSLTPLEHEVVFWTAASPGAIMPHADELIRYLNGSGIRTGVISNNGWSGEALQNRFDRLLPENQFEFVLSSADYMIRKPDPRIFEIALNKADLSAGEVWYCGNDVKADVMGAASVGIFPVFYNEAGKGNACDDLDFELLQIDDWRQMVKILEKL